MAGHSYLTRSTAFLSRVRSMDIIKTYRTYLTITAMAWAGCLVLFVAAYLILLAPQKNREKYYDRALTEKKQVYESAQRAAQEQTKIALDKEIERLRERLKDFVVDFEDSADLTFAIGQIAMERKVAALSIGSGNKRAASTTPVADANTVDETNIDISFISEFNQFAAFVNNLERHRPVFFVHAFKIARSNQDKSLYTVTLDVRALVRRPKETETASISSTRLYSVKK